MIRWQFSKQGENCLMSNFQMNYQSFPNLRTLLPNWTSENPMQLT